MTLRPTRATRWSRPARRAGLATVVLAALALAGCGGAEEQAAPPPTSVGFTAADVPVIVPGAPGEPSTTVAPGQGGQVDNAGRWTQADVDFVSAMVPHHAQALRMAQLAPSRASDDRVTAIAERIAAGQGAEIDGLQAWLTAQGLPEADPEGHGHGGMQGMASQEQLLALTSASGGEFDRLFLQQMTVHHEGALAMADAAAGAANPQVQEMIDDTVVSQGVEIDRMQEVLADLG